MTESDFRTEIMERLDSGKQVSSGDVVRLLAENARLRGLIRDAIDFINGIDGDDEGVLEEIRDILTGETAVFSFPYPTEEAEHGRES